MTSPEPLTPMKRDSTGQIVEEPQEEEEEPGRNSSETTGSFVKLEPHENGEDDPERMPDSQYLAHPVGLLPVFQGEREEPETLNVSGRRCKSPRTQSQPRG